MKPHSEALDNRETPPQTLVLAASATHAADKISRLRLHLEKGQVADLEFERPFYELIVDVIHSHPNSIRVCFICPSPDVRCLIDPMTQLAYSVFPEGCTLTTDGSFLPPYSLDP